MAEHCSFSREFDTEGPSSTHVLHFDAPPSESGLPPRDLDLNDEQRSVEIFRRMHTRCVSQEATSEQDLAELVTQDKVHGWFDRSVIQPPHLTTKVLIKPPQIALDSGRRLSHSI